MLHYCVPRAWRTRTVSYCPKPRPEIYPRKPSNCGGQPQHRRRPPRHPAAAAAAQPLCASATVSGFCSSLAIGRLCMARPCLRGRPAAGPAARRANSERRRLGVYPHGPGRRPPTRTRLTLSLPTAPAPCCLANILPWSRRLHWASGPLVGQPADHNNICNYTNKAPPSSAPFGSLRPAAASQPTRQNSLCPAFALAD